MEYVSILSPMPYHYNHSQENRIYFSKKFISVTFDYGARVTKVEFEAVKIKNSFSETISNKLIETNSNFHMKYPTRRKL